MDNTTLGQISTCIESRSECGAADNLFACDARAVRTLKFVPIHTGERSQNVPADSKCPKKGLIGANAGP